MGLSEVDYYHQKGNCRNEERWRPFFDYLGICNNSEVLQQTCHGSISKQKNMRRNSQFILLTLLTLNEIVGSQASCSS